MMILTYVLYLIAAYDHTSLTDELFIHVEIVTVRLIYYHFTFSDVSTFALMNSSLIPWRLIEIVISDSDFANVMLC